MCLDANLGRYCSAVVIVLVEAFGSAQHPFDIHQVEHHRQRAFLDQTSLWMRWLSDNSPLRTPFEQRKMGVGRCCLMLERRSPLSGCSPPQTIFHDENLLMGVYVSPPWRLKSRVLKGFNTARAFFFLYTPPWERAGHSTGKRQPCGIDVFCPRKPYLFSSGAASR
jgi:hypothetical protein